MEQVKQQLSTMITIQIPEDKVLIDRERFEELEALETYGQFWTLKEFANRCGRSTAWVTKLINTPKLVGKFDIERGGFVYYRLNNSDRYLFHATKAAKFIENDLWQYLKTNIKRGNA